MWLSSTNPEHILKQLGIDELVMMKSVFVGALFCLTTAVGGQVPTEKPAACLQRYARLRSQA
jgi:hypothetical protein